MRIIRPPWRGKRVDCSLTLDKTARWKCASRSSADGVASSVSPCTASPASLPPDSRRRALPLVSVHGRAARCTASLTSSRVPDDAPARRLWPVSVHPPRRSNRDVRSNSSLIDYDSPLSQGEVPDEAFEGEEKVFDPDDLANELFDEVGIAIAGDHDAAEQIHTVEPVASLP